MDLEKIKDNITNNVDVAKKTYLDYAYIKNLISESFEIASRHNQFFFNELNDIIVTDKENKRDATIIKKEIKPTSLRLSEDTSIKLKNLNTGKKTLDEELLNLLNLKSNFDDIKKLIYGLKVWREQFNREDILFNKKEHLYEYLDISSDDYKFILDASLDVIESIAGCSSNKLFTVDSIDKIIPLVELLSKVESTAKSCQYLSPSNVTPVCDLIETMINRINIITEQLKNEAPLIMRQNKIVCRLCLQNLDTSENYDNEKAKDLIKKLQAVEYSEISDIKF